MPEFEATLVKLPGKMDWPVFYVPVSFAEAAGTRGRINVVATVDGAEFRVTLLPSHKGHYLVYAKAMREHCGKNIGDTVQVSLQVDDQPREVELPPDVAAALHGSEAAMAAFTSLPYYMRREEINKINSAKMPSTRERRVTALMDKLLK